MLDRQNGPAVYRVQLPTMLLEHAGEYVVIQDGEVRHFSDCYEHALSWAYDAFGLDGDFFVRKVAGDSDVAHFTRDLGPCRR